MLRTGSARWQVKPQRECGSCCRPSPCGLPCLLLELPRGFERTLNPRALRATSQHPYGDIAGDLLSSLQQFQFSGILESPKRVKHCHMNPQEQRSCSGPRRGSELGQGFPGLGSSLAIVFSQKREYSCS